MAALTRSRVGRALGRWTRADWLVAAGGGVAVAAGARAGFVAEANLRADVLESSRLRELAVQASNVDPTSLLVLTAAELLVLLGLLSRPVRFEAATRPVAVALALTAGLAALFALAVLALSLYLAATGDLAVTAVRDAAFGDTDRVRLALTQLFTFGPLAVVLGVVTAGAVAVSAAAREQR